MGRSLRAGALLGLALATASPPARRPAASAAGITALAPVDPVLLSITPDFAWSPDSPPPPGTAYRLRIARDSGFTSVVVDTLTDTTGYALRRPLKPGRPLFWRVDAAGATTGAVGPIAVPPWATLTTLSAPGGVNTSDDRPTFTWRSPAIAVPPGPFRYDLFVRRAASRFQDIPELSVGGLLDTAYRASDPLERDVAYLWSVVAHAGGAGAGDTSLSRSAGVFVVVDASIPPATLLYQNFPNPFPGAGRDSTCIWFDLAVTGRTELTILDLRGNPVRHVVPGPDFGAMLAAGRYGRGPAGGPTCDGRLAWDGRADDGREVPPGVYLYKLQAGGVIQFRRIVFRGRTR